MSENDLPIVFVLALAFILVILIMNITTYHEIDLIKELRCQQEKLGKE